MSYILALDQGTTSSRSILYDAHGNRVADSQQEFTQHFPQPGWVEHDPLEIWHSQLSTIREVLDKANIDASEIASIGITNQRETTVIWEKKTGRPVYNAIVWQDRRTADLCDTLAVEGLSEYISSNTGLIIDAYFSGTKVAWILDHVAGARERAASGELLCGTIDSWLIYQLTGKTAHITDCSNASRTMLFNIHKLEWDEKLLNRLDIPKVMLPRIVA